MQQPRAVEFPLGIAWRMTLHTHGDVLHKILPALELFWGWKEQIEDYGEESQIWRAAYTTECQIGMKPLIGAKVELTVSALQIAFGMPQCLTKHIGDLDTARGVERFTYES